MEFPKNYLRDLLPGRPLRKTRLMLPPATINSGLRADAAEVKIDVYEYNADQVNRMEYTTVQECRHLKNSRNITWINIDGLRKADVEWICEHYKIHYLLSEDILSCGQRPKMDELDNVMFCLLNMLYFNQDTNSIEQEQVSIVLGKGFVLSFQEEPQRDVFNPVREKLKARGSKLRMSGADYLCYSLIDIITDNYYGVLERLGEHIEMLEEHIIRRGDNRSLALINNLRKELIVLKRNINPVREVINGFMRSDSGLINERITKYFKDVYDHVVQANELVENYRDLMMSIQDLYLTKVNLRLNEVMKVMAIVTCLLAPATVIGGIFGMNFDKIPYLHNEFGFWIAVGLMLLIPLFMVYVFKRRGWFKQ